MSDSFAPPTLKRNEDGSLGTAQLADVVQWFLDNDQRVAIMRALNVEELYQWKQQQLIDGGAEPAPFDHAEDRFAVGLFQVLAENDDEISLFQRISDVLGALEEATKMNESIAESFKLDANEPSALIKSALLPSARERTIYLTSCWLEALCTAEVRMLGWIYQELYKRQYSPQNFVAAQ